ncbi:MAG: asparagine synthase-related protein [Candidatus Bathyarchaeota archaeon]|nr:asparagine synthase-related protein [Candidatus Bathyarchaeota archaeon]
MEKFVLLTGTSNKKTLKNAIKLLKRREDEEVEYHSFQSSVLAIIKTPLGKSKIIEKRNKTIIIIGKILIPSNHKEINDQFLIKSEQKVPFNLKGNGVIFVIDKVTSQIEIIIEPWFRRLVYYSINKKRTIISSEMKGILALDRNLAKHLDKIAIYSYICLYAVYGNRTLFNKIRVFESGKHYRILNNKLMIINRFNYLSNYDYRIDLAKHARSLADRFKSVVNSLVDEGYSSLFLSGGLDSRLILASVNPKNRHKLNAINVGNHYCSDSRLAKIVAKEVDVNFILFKSSPDAVIENAERQAWITEGGSFLGTSICEFMSTLAEGEVIDGNPGDMTIGGTWARKLSKQQADSSLKYNSAGLVLGEPIGRSSIDLEMVYALFGRKKGETVLYELFKLIQDEINTFDFCDNDILKIEYYALNNRWRRVTQHIIAEQRGFEHPFMDDEIIYDSLCVPITIRDARKFQVSVLKLLNKNLANLPSTSLIFEKQNKAELSNISYKTKKILRKIPCLLNIGRSIKRQLLKPQSTKEDTYLPFATWFKESISFKEFIISNLENFKKRSFVPTEKLSKLINQQIAHTHNHIFTLTKLVNLELILKQLYDEEGFK